jgi:hypothetical protein
VRARPHGPAFEEHLPCAGQRGSNVRLAPTRLEGDRGDRLRLIAQVLVRELALRVRGSVTVRQDAESAHEDLGIGAEGLPNLRR